MARYRFNGSVFDSKSIDKIANDLMEYAHVTLPNKVEQFVNALAQRGIVTAKTYTGYLEDLGNVSGMIEFTKETTPTIDGCSAIMYGTDIAPVVQEYLWFGQIKEIEVSPILMSEFGSGNYAIEGHKGSFPSDTAQDNTAKGYWKWQGLDGKWNTFSGIKPTQPMFHAAQKMRDTYMEVAYEVFK